jgi:NAD(P)-dependent dehydrogenase (short-subunit alcohol dehydrogenase family)
VTSTPTRTTIEQGFELCQAPDLLFCLRKTNSGRRLGVAISFCGALPARALPELPRNDTSQGRKHGLFLGGELHSMDRSYVVTGGGRGIGRAIAERLLAGGDAVVVLDRDDAALGWVSGHPAGHRLIPVAGDAADETVTGRAADLAQEAGPLAGWVNNAAVFGDAWLDAAGAPEVMGLITANLSLAVTGCATAVRRFLAGGPGGVIVNVSSHQAQRAVRGALPYATAKAAIEGLTRALAVDYGPRGIRVNAVALGSITTARYEAFLGGLDPATAAGVREQMAALHPLGRVGYPGEVADAVAYLLSEAASFINGAILPVDGGRSALGPDPEQA